MLLEPAGRCHGECVVSRGELDLIDARLSFSSWRRSVVSINLDQMNEFPVFERKLLLLGVLLNSTKNCCSFGRLYSNAIQVLVVVEYGEVPGWVLPGHLGHRPRSTQGSPELAWILVGLLWSLTLTEIKAFSSPPSSKPETKQSCIQYV